jgi:hypothetical protein
MFANYIVPITLEDSSPYWETYWLFEDGSIMLWGGRVVTNVVLIRPLSGRTDEYTVTDGEYALDESSIGSAGD